MKNIYSSLDILTVTSSYGESFPLTICEAMACNTLVISTNVGDAEYILNDNDFIIPINEPMLLADIWRKNINLDQINRNKIGDMNRSRIKKLFDIESIEKMYQFHYNELLNLI
tara:strand:- start:1024 stop:1362 length:339 start_codon:yes stop_codon:yes gene_type:complete